MIGLKAARKRKGLTQKQAAEMAGIAQGYYCEMEQGKKKNPSVDLMNRLSAVLGCTIDEMLNGIAGEEPKES